MTDTAGAGVLAGWLDGLAMRAGRDPAFTREARWLQATILLVVGDECAAVDVWRGRVLSASPGEPITGWDFEVIGHPDEWAEALRTRRDLGEVTMSPRVSLRVRGNQVLAATHWGAVLRLLQLMADGGGSDG